MKPTTDTATPHTLADKLREENKILRQNLKFIAGNDENQLGLLMSEITEERHNEQKAYRAMFSALKACGQHDQPCEDLHKCGTSWGKCTPCMSRDAIAMALGFPVEQDSVTELKATLAANAEVIAKLRKAANQALAMLERHDPGTADAIRNECR